jgi:hypothetical protein
MTQVTLLATSTGDCDGDGVTNAAEINGPDGVVGGGDSTNPTDPCSFNLTQVTLLATSTGDCDGDGVTNAAEINGPDGVVGGGDSTNPTDPCSLNLSQVTLLATSSSDCDGDGVTNAAEINGPDDVVGGGDSTIPTDPCSLNLSQVTLTATSTGDCDGDGVTNANEINSTGTGDPQTDPNDPCAYNEAEQGTPSATWDSADCDGDGNPNGTDPNPLVPTAVNDAYSAPYGTSTTYDILANDDFLENDGNTITRVGGTGGGTVTFDPITGNIAYTPLASEIGTTVTVVYEVCQGTVCDQATVTITVPYYCPTITNNSSDNLSPTACNINDGSIKICGLIPNQGGYSLSYSKNGVPQTPVTLTANASGCITLSGLSAGTYSLLDVTHSTMCPDGSNILGPVMLVGPSGATITKGTTSNPSGCGIADGFIQISGLTAGTEYTLTYDKNGGSQTPITFTASSSTYTIPNLTSGSYTNIMVTNQGCPSNSLTHTLSDPTTATINLSAMTNPTLCSGNDGTFTISGLAPGTYTLYYIKNGINQTPITFTTTGTSYTVYGLTKGSYTNIRVSNSGCVSNSVMATLSDPGAPVLLLGTANQPSSCGASDGSITITGLVAGTTYTLKYRKDGIEQTPIVIHATTSSYSITGLDAAIYSSIYVDQGGCKSNQLSQVLSDPSAAVIAAAVTASPLVCGDNTGSITISGLTSGLSYTLNYVYNGVQQGSSTFTASGTTYVMSGLTAGSYTGINVTQGGCTSNTINLVLSNPGGASIDYEVVDATTCVPGNDGKIIITGLSQGVSYTLTYKKNDIAQSSIIISSSTSTSYIISGLTEGTYSEIKVTQAGCVSNVLNTAVYGPVLPVAPIISSPIENICPATKADLTLVDASNNAGYDLTWHTSASASSSNLVSTPSNVGAGTYYASFYNSTTSCYGPTTAVTVTIKICDADGDGNPDSTDPSPNDPCIGYITGSEITVGSLWASADCDGDGVPNGIEVDTNQDGVRDTDMTDPYNPCSLVITEVTLLATSTGDCDGDGVTNAAEINGPDGAVGGGDGTDPIDPCSLNLSQVTLLATSTSDCDGDGVTNAAEINGPDGVVGGGDSTNPTDPCSFNMTQVTLLATSTGDCDGDGVTNAAEINGPDGVVGGGDSTNPTDPCSLNLSQVTLLATSTSDCDGDGVTNAAEINGPDGVVGGGDSTIPTDPCSLNLSQVTLLATSTGDCDGDGVTNANEINGPDGVVGGGDSTIPTDPCSLNLSQVTLLATSTGDCDGDGVTNANEINSTGTGDPQTDPNDPCAYNETEQGTPSATWNSADCDDDGNPNGTDPNPLVPTALDDSGSVVLGSTTTINILSNDDFLPNDGNTLTQTGGTAGGTVSFNPITGTMDYTPLASEVGTSVTVVYSVCNPIPDPDVCEDATVTISVVSNCVTPILKVLLEGPFVDNGSTGTMTTKLNNLGYLPGQEPSTFLGTATPAGQPYDVAPWNYLGTEGDGYTTALGPKAGYPTNTTDWVLVSLRTSTLESSTVCTKAALLLNDGTVQMVEGFDCCDIDLNQTYYIVIEHRNHLLVMSPAEVAIVNNTITYDFTTQNSYKELLGYGQKLISGKYVMYGGNGQQVISSSADTDINSNDSDLWRTQNGSNSSYYLNDFELNGDANVQDKNLWLLNNGKFSDVPR